MQDACFRRIEHEEAMVAAVYQIAKSNGEQFILKVSERVNDYLREAHFLKHFSGILPVPRIIQLVPPASGAPGAILMECIPGALLNATELTDGLAYEISRSLALIHQSRLPGYGDPMEADLRADPRVYFSSKFEEGLEECKEGLPIDLIHQCQRYYEANLDLLMSVDGPCVVHRDFRPGNLIVHEGRLQGVIDWAGARASFAEEDFCSLEHGEWPSNPHGKKFF